MAELFFKWIKQHLKVTSSAGRRTRFCRNCATVTEVRPLGRFGDRSTGGPDFGHGRNGAGNEQWAARGIIVFNTPRLM